MKVAPDFAFLKDGIAYLDSAASAQKPRQVLDAMRKFYEDSYANVHRGGYERAERATKRYEDARKTVAKFINASPKEVVFVRNATEAINLVARSWGAKNVGKGTILLTQMEHHSNIVPWQILAEHTGAKLRYVPITKDGLLDRTALSAELKKKPKFFAVTHVSNVLGTINPIKELIAEAHKYGVPVLVDACQSAPHMPIDVKSCDADFLVFSGHKLYGPSVGVLYAKRQILENMPPFLGGGEMIKQVFTTHSSWNEVPWKFEAGTPSIAGAVGLAAAIDYVTKLGMNKIVKHQQELTTYAMSKLKKNSLVTIIGPKKRAGLISFTFGDMHAHDVATVLDHFMVCARAGQHCAQPLHDALGIPATTRVSFGIYNTKKDVDKFIKALGNAKEVFRL